MKWTRSDERIASELARQHLAALRGLQVKPPRLAEIGRLCSQLGGSFSRAAKEVEQALQERASAVSRGDANALKDSHKTLDGVAYAFQYAHEHVLDGRSLGDMAKHVRQEASDQADLDQKLLDQQ